MSPSLLQPMCPAARPIGGVAAGHGGIVCDVMRHDADRADTVTEGDAAPGVFLRLATDGSTVVGFCCGTGLPTISDEVHAHYTSCPIWREALDRDAGERIGGPMPERLNAPLEQDPWSAEDDREVREFLYGEAA